MKRQRGLFDDEVRTGVDPARDGGDFTTATIDVEGKRLGAIECAGVVRSGVYPYAFRCHACGWHGTGWADLKGAMMGLRHHAEQHGKRDREEESEANI